jgi:ABC-type Fe3+-siderophore transport system permease subunit
MSPQDRLARRRWFTILLARLGGMAGAMFGLLLLTRAETVAPKVLGIAIVLSAMAMIAIVPRSLARRWRTPVE